MARRKAATRSRGRSGTPGWMWLATGILIGLGLAWYLFAKGYIPQPETVENDTGPGNVEISDSEEIAPASEKEKKERPRDDFFTIVPEMEVVVPEEELSRQSRAQPETPVTGEGEDESAWIRIVQTDRRIDLLTLRDGDPLDLGGGEVMKLAYIPSGRFLLGDVGGFADELPRTAVDVDGFYLGCFEVTRGQYTRFDPTHHNGYHDQHHGKFPTTLFFPGTCVNPCLINCGS